MSRAAILAACLAVLTQLWPEAGLAQADDKLAIFGKYSGLVVTVTGDSLPKELIVRSGDKILDRQLVDSPSPFVRKYLIPLGYYTVTTNAKVVSTYQASAGEVSVFSLVTANGAKPSYYPNFFQTKLNAKFVSAVEIATVGKVSLWDVASFRQIEPERGQIILEVRRPIPRPDIPDREDEKRQK